MNFGQALDEMKKGLCVARSGWNGKNMHIYLEDGYSHKIGAGVFKGTGRTYEPVVTLFTAQGTHQPGWVCSQPDMLADDWGVVSGG